MRDFFIRAMELIVNVLMILLFVGLLLASLAAMAGLGDFRMAGMSFPGGTVVLGLAMLVFGGLYLLLIGGFLYLGLGIYQNTRRTAEALEQLARRN